MSLEQLPLELAEMVFDRLDGRSYLRMRHVSRTMASVAENYIGSFTCSLSVARHGSNLTAEVSRVNMEGNKVYFVFRRQPVSVQSVVRASVNGLGFWLKRLRQLTFDKMDSYVAVNRMKEAITVLESVGIQRRVEVAILETMWLGSPEFADAMKHLQDSKLNLAIAGKMIAKHSFKTQRSKNPNLMSLGKLINIHIQIPGNRMVSDRLVFEDGSVVDLFKITSCGDERPALWNVGAMADLFQL